MLFPERQLVGTFSVTVYHVDRISFRTIARSIKKGPKSNKAHLKFVSNMSNIKCHITLGGWNGMTQGEKNY